jgi:3-methylcrotonyl-CoA carboxylase alpha subunit
MHAVLKANDLAGTLASARREALGAFNDQTLMLERYLTHPLHIEVQVLGDNLGNVIHLGERECTIQRRHQKVLEESPSPAVSPELRSAMTESALKLARAAGYTNAGTVEFIYEDGNYYFLEMNTRIQVEHPVTEEALGIDLVQEQIRIASGQPLSIHQNAVRFERHALEVRLYAEDPDRGFLPSTGKIVRLEWPKSEEGIRIDAGVEEGDDITPYYDPMVAKIIASGPTRVVALARMHNALTETLVQGPTTNLDFLRWLVVQPQLMAGDVSTRFIEEHYTPGSLPEVPMAVVLGASAFLTKQWASPRSASADKSLWTSHPWRQARQQMPSHFSIDGRSFDASLSAVRSDQGLWNAKVLSQDSVVYDGAVKVSVQGGANRGNAEPLATVEVGLQTQGVETNEIIRLTHFGPAGGLLLEYIATSFMVRPRAALSTDTLKSSALLSDKNSLESPMPGKILQLLVNKGDEVSEDQPLVVVEAMKMEFTVRAPHQGRVTAVHYSEGDQVSVGDILVELEQQRAT